MSRLLFIAFSTSALICSSCHETKPNVQSQSLLSLIDDYELKGQQLHLRLMDYPLPLSCSVKDTIRCKLLKAFHEGSVLCYTIVNDSIIAVSTPSQRLVNSYLGQLVVVPELRAEDLIYMELPLNTLTDSFEGFLSNNYHLTRTNMNLNSCCEVRAGLIAKFLRNHFTSNACKLFLKGKLVWKDHGKSYRWSNHVLNLIPCKIRDENIFVVYDPFSEHPFTTITDYLNTMISLGSRIQQTCLTHDQILSLNFPSKQGIPDFNFQNSEYLIKHARF